MAAMQAALPVDAGAYSCALALDTVCYSVWIALLLLAVKYAGRWNASVKADTSTLQAIAESANAEVAKEKKAATSADWIFLIGLSLMVSALSQMVGKSCNAALAGVGLGMFDKGTLTTVFVSILGLICAGTSLGKLPAVEELSNVYLYVVVSLLASTASVSDLLSAPMWVVYGLFILVIHVLLMYLLSKVFHWDLFWAVACGGVVGAIINFSLNRYWTFRDKQHAYRHGLKMQLLKFAATVTGSILLKYLGTYALEHGLGIDYKIGKLISDLFVSVLFNYTLQRFWVFRKAKS